MKKDDTLDTTAWRAWRWGREPLDADPAPAVEPEATDTRSEAATTDDAPPRQHGLDGTLLDLYAEAIEDLWRAPDRAAIVEPIVTMSRKVFGMFHAAAFCRRHPQTAVRIARMFVSVWHLGEREEMRFISHGISFAELRDPEVVELVVEVAARGDRRLASHLGGALSEEDLAASLPRMGARLAWFIESARSWRAREIALGFLTRGRWTEGDPWLRAALRWPHLRSRHIALATLLERDALRAEEVAWLVEDAVAHPIDSGRITSDELAPYYEARLLDAIARHRPAKARDALLKILRGDCALIDRDRRWLSIEWALHALTLLNPAEATAPVEAAARAERSYERYRAVAAAAALPEAEARRLLATLAADPSALISESAREAWAKRFASDCPWSLLEGVPCALLDAPPSAVFESRVRVLRGRDRGAVDAMTRAICAEAPTRETLALTLYALRVRGHFRAFEGAPDDESAWVEWLHARHGELAIDAIVGELEGAAIETPWLAAREALVARSTSPEDTQARLRAVALRRVRDPNGGVDYTALSALAHLPVTEAVVERLEAMMVDSRDGRDDWYIAKVLTARGPDADLDARLFSRVVEAVLRGDWRAYLVNATVGVERDVASIVARALDDVFHLENPDAAEALDRLAWALRERGHITDAHVVDALAELSSPLRARIGQWLPEAEPYRAQVIARWWEALASSAPGPAARALFDLTRYKLLALDDPRVDEVFARAPLEHWLDILGVLMRDAEGSAERWQLSIEQLLKSPDGRRGADAIELLSMHRDLAWDEAWVEGLFATMPPSDVRDALAHRFRYATDAEVYFHWDEDDD